VAVHDQLPGLGARIGEAHAVDDVVETGLENLQEIVARHATTPNGLLVVLAKLRLENAVVPAHLLLLAKLQAELGRAPGAALSVLAGAVAALADRTLVGVAARALQIELDALT